MQPKNFHKSHFCNDGTSPGICRSNILQARQAFSDVDLSGSLRHSLCIFNTRKKES